MGLWNPVANLREYISSNPPGSTFFLCVLTLAVTFLTLSSYSRTHTLPNPDTAKLKLCESVNTSTSQSASLAPSPRTAVDQTDGPGPNSTESPPIMSWHLSVPLVVSTSSPRDSPRDVSLHTTLKASQLNMGGDEVFAVSLELPSGNDTHSCLTLVGPANLVPTRLFPPECLVSKNHFQSIEVEVSDALLPAASQHCFSLQSKVDPTLTVMLTKEERGLAVHHLLEFSLCLFVFCFLFCFAASLSHTVKRRQPSISLDSQNEPLIHEN